MEIRVKLTRDGTDKKIHTMDLEEYLRGVVPSEMSASRPSEALKAQAICARTFALKEILKQKDDYDLDDTSKYQAYRESRIDIRSDNAVKFTKDIVVSYNNKLAKVYYSASNGGRTTSSKAQWGTAYPYLIEKNDPYDHEKKNGHGVGMSQNGAYSMANEKYNYNEILSFYFPGTELKTIQELGYEKDKEEDMDKYILYDMESGDNSIIGEYNSADVALAAAWEQYNVYSNTDVFLVNPNGNTYTPDKKQNENPYNNVVWKSPSELYMRYLTTAQALDSVWKLYNGGDKSAFMVNGNGQKYTPSNKPDSENPMNKPTTNNPAIKPNGVTIALDAGHGMFTAGKQTPKFPKDYPNIKKGEIIKENEANRKVAQYAKTALVRCGFSVIFTSDMTGKTDVSLSDRQKACRNAKANFMASCHFNAGGGNGISMYYHNKNTSSVAKKFCDIHLKNLGKIKGQRMRGTAGHAFAVCNESQTKCPSVLIEHAFMDDPKWVEPPLMRDESYLKACGEALCNSICEIFKRNYIKG